jgi:hypothetical protein
MTLGDAVCTLQVIAHHQAVVGYAVTRRKKRLGREERADAPKKSRSEPRSLHPLGENTFCVPSHVDGAPASRRGRSR